MKPYFVILSGAKGNSGDDLIRKAATALFERYRPDREVVRLDGWVQFDKEKLELVNGAQALILLGGPALRYDTFPNVYPLVPDLNDIKVPIVTLGIGYRDADGDWSRTSRFELSEKTKELLSRVETSGFGSGVRCYHTLNVLLANGYRKFTLSGCPAFYHLDHLHGNGREVAGVGNVAFATGRMYLANPSLRLQQERIIISLARYFKDRTFTVAFHDPVRMDHPAIRDLVRTLERENIAFRDISGAAENLEEFYNKQDLQIGYRVHAHIYMCSRDRPSVLLCEDGRGKGMRATLGGLIFDAYETHALGTARRIRNKLMTGSAGSKEIRALQPLEQEVLLHLDHEMRLGFPRIAGIRPLINSYSREYIRLLQQLP